MTSAGAYRYPSFADIPLMQTVTLCVREDDINEETPYLNAQMLLPAYGEPGDMRSRFRVIGDGGSEEFAERVYVAWRSHE